MLCAAVRPRTVCACTEASLAVRSTMRSSWQCCVHRAQHHDLSQCQLAMLLPGALLRSSVVTAQSFCSDGVQMNSACQCGVFAELGCYAKTPVTPCSSRQLATTVALKVHPRTVPIHLVSRVSAQLATARMMKQRDHASAQGQHPAKATANAATRLSGQRLAGRARAVTR